MTDIEFKSPEEIKVFQEGLLQEALQYLQGHSRYYQRMFEKYHIDIAKIRTIEDLQKIPFTEKKDLQLFYDCEYVPGSRLYLPTTYKVEDTSIISLGADGTIKGLKVGTTKIIATAKTGVKKAYTFQMNESRRAMIEAYTAQLTCSIIEGNADVHEIHKGNIIRAALQAPIKNEIIILDGKSVGLLKYALRQAA